MKTAGSPASESQEPAARSPRRLAWLGGLFIATLACESGYEVWRSHQATVRAIEADAASQARLIAEQTARGVQAVDVVLRQVAREIRTGALSLDDPRALHLRLREQADGLVQSDGLALFDEAGQVLAMSQVPPDRMPTIRLAGQAPFGNLRDHADAGLVIGSLRSNPNSGQRIFPIARRLSDANGKFLGAIGAPGRVEYFQGFYRDAVSDPSTRIALLHRDGTLLARHPPMDAALGRRLDDVHRLLPADGAARSAFARLPSPVDGADHFVALQAVPDHPLVVAVSRDAQAALEPWRNRAIGTLTRTLLLGGLAAAMLWTALRQLARARAAGQHLAVSEERYALAMTGSDEGHWLWDIPAGQVYVSDRLARMFSLSGHGAVMEDDQYFSSMPLHPDDLERVHLNRNDHLAGRTPRLDHEFRIVEPATGRVRWIHTRAQCFRDERGQPLRMAGSTVDVTARKEAELERERLERQLRQSQKLEAIGTLAGGIAHDFNNILSAILGHGELAQRDAPAGSALRRHVDAVIAAGQRARSLVERILAFSRSGVGERAPVHVQSVVAEALDGLAASMPPGIALERDLRLGDAGVMGDATQIHQVVLNLCTNAMQAMGESGRLRVSLDRVDLAQPMAVATSTLAAGAYVRLRVADTGGGIDPDVLDRIFDPFFTTKGVGVGTGLGLSMVHGIVTDLGGGIAVQGGAGGSVFAVYLPAGATVAEARAAPVEPRDLPRGDGQTILLVEDEPSLLPLAEEMLAGIGYEPVGFADAQLALAALQSQPERFDLLLTDESMPAMNGTELAAHARALRPDLPIVLVSGLITPEVLHRCAALDVSAVLRKPLGTAEVAGAVAQALARAAATESPETSTPT